MPIACGQCGGVLELAFASGLLAQQHASMEQVHLERLKHAWVEPDGTVHPVTEWGHENWAIDQGHESYDLRRAGWIKLSEGDWINSVVTQQQLNVIYDWHLANREKFRAEDYAVQ